MRWQIQDMLDFHADDGTVDVLEVPHPEHVSHVRQIFAVAAKNSLLAEEAVLATNAGLNLSIIDIMETAQRNVATGWKHRGARWRSSPSSKPAAC